MLVKRSAWVRYIEGLRKVSDQAVAEAQAFLARHMPLTAENSQLVIEYCYALANKYGEAAAALACEMYDALAAAQGVHVPPAEPASPATYPETARAVLGTANVSEPQIPQTVGRLVKQAGADTTLQNALRDGAEHAWIPHGDTCPYCLMLASNGWQRASKRAIKNGHAQHIHTNCDCTYAVRFDGESEVSGYTPDKYLQQYSEAPGSSWQQKVNAMRREQYAATADQINAQKRIAYRAREDRRKAEQQD